MVRDRVVGVRHVDPGERLSADAVAHHEGDDAREVALHGERHEVEHEADAGREDRPVGRPGGGDAGGGCLAEAKLELADAGQILVELAPVGGAEPVLQPLGVCQDRVDDALVVGKAPRALLGGRLRVVAGEHEIEDRARAHHLRHRATAPGPGDIAGVGAAVAAVAAAGARASVGAELERGEAGLGAECRCRHLVHRDSVVDLLRLGDRAAGEEAGSGRGVLAEGVGHRRPVVDSGQHQHLALDGRERGEDGRQRVVRAGGRRHPVGHVHAVRRVHDEEALLDCGRLGGQAARAQAGEERERQRDAGAAEERASVEAGHGLSSAGSSGSPRR